MYDLVDTKVCDVAVKKLVSDWIKLALFEKKIVSKYTH